MNRLRPPRAAVSALRCAGILLLLATSGCWSIKAYSKHETPVLQTGGRIVIAINWHERLRNFSARVEDHLTAEFARRGIEVLHYRPPGISLEESPVMTFAKAHGADRILVYSLGRPLVADRPFQDPVSFDRNGGIVSHPQGDPLQIVTEGSLVDVPTGKTLWQGSVDYKDNIPLPGSSGRSAQRLSDTLIQKLAEDGFLVQREPIAGTKAPATSVAE